jgi:hypothetical protein
VAADHDLARDVNDRLRQLLPEQQVVGLPGERHVRVDVGVDEEVGRRLVPPEAVPLEEPPVRLRDAVQVDLLRLRHPVGGQCLPAAAVEPSAASEVVLAGVQHQRVVVAQQRHETAGGVQGDETVEDAPRVRAAVNVVAQRDQ